MRCLLTTSVESSRLVPAYTLSKDSDTCVLEYVTQNLEAKWK